MLTYEIENFKGDNGFKIQFTYKVRKLSFLRYKKNAKNEQNRKVPTGQIKVRTAFYIWFCFKLKQLKLSIV